jgi:hypothetical protein
MKTLRDQRTTGARTKHHSADSGLVGWRPARNAPNGSAQMRSERVTWVMPKASQIEAYELLSD